ncbi:hypothetical protein E2C01_083045 [Portunus trituberculatus]|uniref:Uncharacterized protein n=1 Tax=Portunus trituberculatus TaxID=210409 RepID=A0A5B7IRF7_PORTR|nr:hypothetical protein [Portunus trituberculatus]
MNDVPFVVKQRVFDAALMSTPLYGCESWLGADLEPIIRLYNCGIKQLLGVRKPTQKEVCYTEAGNPSLPDSVMLRHHKFFKKNVSEKGMGSLMIH